LKLLLNKFKDVSYPVLAITLLVVILNLTIVPLEAEMFARFIIGAILIIIGLGIFLFGAEIGVEPIGVLMGEMVAKTNKFSFISILGFVLGFFITVAEPDLLILAIQVNNATGGVVPTYLTLIVVSMGVGLMVAIGLLRILYRKPLNKLFTIIYSILIIMGFWVAEEFLAIAVDASGATTGAMTTPFILALGLGTAQLRGGKGADEDSFGLVGVASTGPILAVMILNMFFRQENIHGQAEAFVSYSGIITPYIKQFPKYMKESVLTLAPIFILFVIFNAVKFHLTKRKRNRIYKGLIYTYIGLTLFLVGVNAGFMEIGRLIGNRVASLEFNWILPIIGFLMGMLVVLAEPAVYVLTQQIEEETADRIKRRIILITLSIGIAFAVTMSMLRIMIPGLKLWHFLLPGFVLALILSYIVPPIFVGIAFDAGGVASGPMTATFVLAFAQGAADAIPTANVLVDGFGVIALVAMMPLVALQVLGLLVKRKEKRLANKNT